MGQWDGLVHLVLLHGCIRLATACPSFAPWGMQQVCVERENTCNRRVCLASDAVAVARIEGGGHWGRGMDVNSRWSCMYGIRPTAAWHSFDPWAIQLVRDSVGGGGGRGAGRGLGRVQCM